MKQSRAWRGLVLAVIAALAIGGASLSAFAADWDAQDVHVTLTKVSSGQVSERTVNGVIKDEETLYLQVADIFGSGGVAEAAGAEWTVRDGRVYFPATSGIESIEIETVDGLEYVPAIETLSKLGIGRALVNQSQLFVQVW